MAHEPESPQTAPGPENSDRRPPLGKGVIILRIVLPLLVIGIGLGLSLWLMETGPEAKPRTKNRNATLVNVQTVEFKPRQIRISAMGTVRPKQEVHLKPQVTGKIVAISDEFLPGGFFRTGEVLLRIDDTDYRLTVEQLASDVARAEAELQLEQGNQLVSLKEFELLGEAVSDEEKFLMLRQPQLENLRAALAAAESRLEQARINLQRAEIRAPFNAIVFSREVNLGTRVTTGSDLAMLVGTDAYWVEVSVPVSRLRWIEIPRSRSEHGASVMIYDQAAWGDGVNRVGWVARLSAAIEEKGRMARLLIEVPDPQALEKDNSGKPGLLLHSYVRVEIEGRELMSTAAISRDLLRDDDTVWIMDRDNRLDIRKVEIAFRGEEEIYLTAGLENGERLITSLLPTPVQGMPLRLPGDPEQQEKAELVEQPDKTGKQ